MIMYWMWILIALVAIVAKFMLKSQKNQIEMSKTHQDTGNRVNELEQTVNKLTRRIENLEAIAATDPDDFKESNVEETSASGFMEKEKEKNKDIVNNLAQKRRAGS